MTTSRNSVNKMQTSSNYELVTNELINDKLTKKDDDWDFYIYLDDDFEKGFDKNTNWDFLDNDENNNNDKNNNDDNDDNSNNGKITKRMIFYLLTSCLFTACIGTYFYKPTQLKYTIIMLNFWGYT